VEFVNLKYQKLRSNHRFYHGSLVVLPRIFLSLSSKRPSHGKTKSKSIRNHHKKKKRLTKQMKMKSGKRLLTNEFFLDKLERCFPCTRYGSCNFFLIIVYDPLMLGCPCSLEADFFELSITRQLQISVL
jgi:hypothetical protein